MRLIPLGRQGARPLDFLSESVKHLDPPTTKTANVDGTASLGVHEDHMTPHVGDYYRLLLKRVKRHKALVTAGLNGLFEIGSDNLVLLREVSGMVSSQVRGEQVDGPSRGT